MRVLVILLMYAPVLAQSSIPDTPDLGTPAPIQRNCASSEYQFVSLSGRLRWWADFTLSPSRLLIVGPMSAGWGTLRDVPSEYGSHWDGFGKRNGMRLTGVATGNLIEATVGTAWGEDPRYFRSGLKGFRPRIKYIIRTTFIAPHRDGRWHPAYARFAGDIGNNFLSNTWRADSEANTSHAVVRCVWGVLGRMTGDAFEEFWPDIRHKVFKK
jgi:hypothetical protein